MIRHNFDLATEIKAAENYVNGATVRELAAEVGVSTTTITAILHRQAVALRPGGTRTNWTGSTEQRAEAVRLYTVERAGVRTIGQLMRCSDHLIRRALMEAGVAIRAGNTKLDRYTDEQIAEVADRHEAGESVYSLARELRVSGKFLQALIRRIGRAVSLREFEWPPAKHAEVLSRYMAGETQNAIAARMGCNQAGISRSLKKSGISHPKFGPGNPAWAGGRSVSKSLGYVTILVTEEDLKYCVPNYRGRVLEHRLVMGRMLGRRLERHETVHHINGDGFDNRPENLQLRQGRHGKGAAFECRDCGSHNVQPVPLKDAA